MRIKALCPHCQEEVIFDAEVQLQGIYKPDNSDENSKYLAWKGRLSENEVALLDQAQKVGILEAMMQAFTGAPCQPPKNPHKFFLDFLASAVPMMVPISSLDLLIAEFGGRIEVMQWQQIVGILSDKQLMAFAPLAYLGPSKNGNKEKRLSVSYEALTQGWLKTKMGYVPQGARVFGEQIRRKNFGDFARLVQ